ncbi:MAG: hypothetical protein ACREB2_13785 [Pseudolabrys sp.]
MSSLRPMCRLAAALAALSLLVLPARAEVEKFMKQCDMKLCAFFRASTMIPEGWVEDKEATDYFNFQMLLPKGVDFEKAPAKIYVLVRYDKDKQLTSSMLRDNERDWKSRSKKAKIVKLADFARANGNAAFERHQFEAPALSEQGFEEVTLTSDSDKDGNSFVVEVVLSANTREAFKASEPDYLSILRAY